MVLYFLLHGNLWEIDAAIQIIWVALAETDYGSMPPIFGSVFLYRLQSVLGTGWIEAAGYPVREYR